jgi:hypothetical protein
VRPPRRRVVQHCAGRADLESRKISGGFDLFGDDHFSWQYFFAHQMDAICVQILVYQRLDAKVLHRMLHFPRLA